MHFPLHPYAILSIVSALIALSAAITAWQRSGRGSLTFGFLLFSGATWSGFYTTQWLDISLSAKIFFLYLMYIGVIFLPTLFLLFVLEFTRHETWLTRGNLILLSIPPAAFLFLLWTNAYHHLFYSSVKAVEVNNIMALEFTRGPWYFINIIYSYIVIGVALLILSQTILHSSPLYLNQYRLVLIGSLLPWVSSLFSENNFDRLGGLDLTPFTFSLSGLIFVFAVLRTHFMDLIPVARSYLVENMQDGILVLDQQNRVVDLNPAMENFLESKASFFIGKNATEILAIWLQAADLWNEMETRAELRVPKDPSRYLDLRVTPLYDKDHLLSGRLLVFHDVTERKQVEKRLRYVNDRLQSQLVEIGLLQSKLREQALRDPLTDLFNRRYLEETLDRELARAMREGYSVCIMMIDLDHFKKVNDTYGHEAGDHVLKALAHTLSVESRRGDFACRYGGEEFVIVMPNIDTDTAYARAEKLRESLNALRVPYGIYTLTITISMGIASFPTNGQTRDRLLRAADQAMYAAKGAGRDHILSYDQLQLPEETLED